MSKTPLFSEFEPVSAKQWKQKIQVDLRGADYNDSLIWESLEGLNVKPFYTQEDVQPNFTLPTNENAVWQIGQQVYAGNERAANKKALDVIDRGATTLFFKVPERTIDWSTLLNGILLESTPIHFEFQFLERASIKTLLDHVGDRPTQLSLNIDIIGHLAKTGNWFHDMKKDHQLMDDIVQLVNKKVKVSTISVDMGLYQNAGANIVQQLAYGLAHVNEYLNHYDDNVSEAKEKPVVFKVGIGPNYFFEIAKLRAIRWLWYTLSTEYGLKHDCCILAQPSRRNKTLYDYNVNMLRTTSECMSAVLGGADVVCNLPYDAIYHKDNEFGERIARNQLLLLKEESYFDEGKNAANGSYYIEQLTSQLAQKALTLFQQIEASGGFLKELKNGTIQRKIKESAAKEQQLFDDGKLVLLGTNAYQNPNDKMKHDLEIFPFLKQDRRKTIIPRIIERRLSESLEQNRLNDE